MESTVRYDSPVGPMELRSAEGFLTGIAFLSEQTDCKADDHIPQVLEQTIAWLDRYFRGEPVVPDLPLRPRGTAFQQLIWQLLLQIPYGGTRTYGDLAREAARILGKERMSSQAVGQAVGRNPIAVMIPCHRVVGAGGTLTGYAYGIHRKQWLLNMEQERKNTQCAVQHSEI